MLKASILAEASFQLILLQTFDETQFYKECCFMFPYLNLI